MTQMTSPSELEFDLLDRLHKAMRISGKSAGALAADLGVHRNTVGNYLNGRTPLDRRTVVAWAWPCRVPVEWLEHGTGPSGPTDPGPGGPAGDTPPSGLPDAVERLAAGKRRHADGADTHRYLVAA